MNPCSTLASGFLEAAKCTDTGLAALSNGSAPALLISLEALHSSRSAAAPRDVNATSQSTAERESRL